VRARLIQIGYINVCIFSREKLSPVKNCPVKFLRATAAANNGVPHVFSPCKTLPCDIYGCGGGLHVSSINAPRLLKIYCCYLVRAADVQSVSGSQVSCCKMISIFQEIGL